MAKNIILSSIILTTLLFIPSFKTFLPAHAIAYSPNFIRQEMMDDYNDVFNIDRPGNKGAPNDLIEKYTNNAIDIHEVSYLSDGRTLNATLWLASFQGAPLVDYLSYGMYIDVDGGFKNGISDTDYSVTVEWDKNKGNWTRLFTEHTPSGAVRTINKEDNYTGFYGKGDAYGYVQLSADLSKMVYPQNYDVTFYTIYQKGNSTFSDVTNGIHVPPLKSAISIQLSPNPINLRPGDEKTIQIEASSNTTAEPIVDFHINNQTSDIKYTFENNQLHVPKLGTATTSLNIRYTGNTTASLNVLPINADITIPYPTAFPQYSNTNNINPSKNTAVHSTVTSEQSNLIINLLPPDYNLTVSPNPLELRSGEERNLQVQIKSVTNLNSHVSLYSKEYYPLEVTFSPNEIFVPPMGLATSIIHVKVPENSSVRPFTFPILANFSIQKSDGGHVSRIKPQILSNSIYQNITKNADLTISILPALSFGERFNNIYSVWIAPVSGIWTFLAGLAAVITPLILRKKQREKEEKKKSKLQP